MSHKLLAPSFANLNPRCDGTRGLFVGVVIISVNYLSEELAQLMGGRPAGYLADFLVDFVM